VVLESLLPGWLWPVGVPVNSDGYGNVALLHKLSDNGIHALILYGATRTRFLYNPTFARNLAASGGWNWGLVKVV
jgi:hypothetical protein